MLTISFEGCSNGINPKLYFVLNHKLPDILNSVHSLKQDNIFLQIFNYWFFYFFFMDSQSHRNVKVCCCPPLLLPQKCLTVLNLYAHLFYFFFFWPIKLPESIFGTLPKCIIFVALPHWEIFNGISYQLLLFLHFSFLNLYLIFQGIKKADICSPLESQTISSPLLASYYFSYLNHTQTRVLWGRPSSCVREALLLPYEIAWVVLKKQ